LTWCAQRLRNINDANKEASGGIILKDRMGALMIKIAKDVESCGNVCDTYSKKNLLGLYGNFIHEYQRI